MIAILTWDDCVDWNFERKSIASIGPPAASHKFSSAESCSHLVLVSFLLLPRANYWDLGVEEVGNGWRGYLVLGSGFRNSGRGWWPENVQGRQDNVQR